MKPPRLTEIFVATAILFGALAVVLHRWAQPPTIAASPASVSKSHVVYGAEFWRPKKTERHQHSKTAALPFDVDEVIERASHAWNREADGFSVVARRYSARLSEGALSMKLGVNCSAEFRTASISRGETSIPKAPSAAVESFANVVQTRLQSGVNEHWEARREGVSITWIFDSAPAGSGPLTIKAQLAGVTHVSGASDGMHFATAAGRGLRIGNVTAVDSAGRHWSLAAETRASQLLIGVPEQIINEAVYPLAIDPLISPEFGVDEPVDTLDPHYQEAPAIAFNGSVYLVAWSEGDPTSTTRSIRVARYDPAGRALGESEEFPRRPAYYPALASDGEGFLMVYNVMGATQQPFMFGARFDGNGRLISDQDLNATGYGTLASNGNDYLHVSLDSSGPLKYVARRITAAGAGPAIDLTSMVGNGLSAASDGANYLAVWSVWENNLEKIWALRISADGQPINPAPFVISSSPAGQERDPKIAFSHGVYAVTWLAYTPTNTTQLRCRRLNANTTFVDANPFVIAESPSLGAHVVTADANGFLLAWSSRQNTTGSGDVQGRRLPTSGAMGPAFPILAETRMQTQTLFAAPSGDDTFLIWYGYTAESSGDIMGRLVTGDNAVGPLQIIATGPNVEAAPAVAFGDNGYLVVWQDNRNALTNEDDIFGIYVDENGRPKSSRAITIATGPNDQSSPAVTAARDHYLVAWREAATDSASSDNIQGALLMNDAVVRQLSLCVETNSQRAPAVAAAGTNFLAVWRDDRSQTNNDIYGIHIDFDGSLVGPLNGFPICNDTNAQTAPVVASNGTNYLVVWRDSRNVQFGANDDIYGAIVEPRSVTTPESIPISAIIPQTQRAPDVASNGRDYFVVWRDSRNSGGAPVAIYGTPVSAAGVVANPFGIPLVPGAPNQREPAIVRLGGDYLLVWLQDSLTEPNVYRAYSRTISADGSSAGEYAATGGSGYDSEILNIASGASGQILVVAQSTNTPSRTLATQICFSNCPVTLSSTLSGSVPTITWNAEANATYRVEFKRDLNDVDWQTLKEVVTTEEGFQQVSDPAAPNDAPRFYRIQRLP